MRTWRAPCVVVALVVAVLGAGLRPAALHGEPSIEVIVSGGGTGAAGAEAAVARVGGTVVHRLDLIDAVAARVSVRAAARLADDPSVAGVTPNGRVTVQGDLAADVGPQSVYRTATGADTLGAEGLTGRGVTVALVDTGVAPVPDLGDRIREVTDPVTGEPARCVDFSGEDHCGDSYGHGTFMAGIIAGDGTASGGEWVGMAPEAQILSLKVAGRDGSSDVGKVLAAIQWVVSFRDQYDIDILNLSLGTDSTQSWDVDPFNYAVERAWHAGIVVTVAGSNRGPEPGTISKPGDDPWVITVGAVDDRATPPLADDRLPDFSSRGPTAAGVAKPDVVAPGARIVSLRAPDSAIESDVPSSFHHPSYRRGSGTSMATAMVSGGVALLLQRDPHRSPDQVKHALASTARPVAGGSPMEVGSGAVDLPAAAVHVGHPTELPDRWSSGQGSVDASRGTVQVTSDGVLGSSLTAGTITWDPIGFTTGDWRADTWPATTWASQHWARTSWYGNNWHGNNWHGNNWHGDWETDGDGSDPYGRPLPGAVWYGAWD